MPVNKLPLGKRVELYSKVMERYGDGERGIANKLGINRSTVSGWVNKKRKPGSRYNIPNLVPSQELAYVIGTYYGDGYVYKNGRACIIGLQVKDREFINKFNRSLSKILNRVNDSTVQSPPSANGMYIVRITNRLLYEFLNKPLEEHKYFIESFPSLFVRAFFDGEGTIHSRFCERKGYNWWQNTICAYNTDLELLYYVRHLLFDYFSIMSRINLIHRKGAINTSLKRIAIARSNCYRLRICRQDGILKFYREIGFSINRKQEKLIKMVERINNAN